MPEQASFPQVEDVLERVLKGFENMSSEEFYIRFPSLRKVKQESEASADSNIEMTRKNTQNEGTKL